MRRRRKILLGFGVALGLAVLIPAAYHWKLKRTNEAYIRQLASQGEPMTLAQVLPPAVPAAENSADIFLRAAALLEADTSSLQTNTLTAMLPVGPGRAALCSQLPEAPGSELTNSWADVSRALAQNEPALDLLRQVIAHPALDFHFQYADLMSDTHAFTNLHLVELRKAEKYLNSDAICSLHDGKTGDAIADLRALLSVINGARCQRLMINEWVRMAMLHNGQRVCWEILRSPDVTEDELSALQSDWEQIDFLHSGLDALVMERASGEITLADWRASDAGLTRYLGLMRNAQASLGVDVSETLPDKARIAGKIFLWRYWWSYPDELLSLKGYQELLSATRFAATNGGFHTAITNQNAGLAALGLTGESDPISGMLTTVLGDTDFHSLMSQSIATLSSSAKKTLLAETARRMTITAIAVQRYKLAHGRYPNHLSGLIPAYLSTIPLDPVDAQPLRYHREADGTFLLYSIGENGVDDGGDPGPADHGTPKTFYWQSSDALDWVWPQATTADGVQFIYTPAGSAK